MKKIAFVIKLFQDNNFYGGGEKLFFKLIQKFIEHKYLVDIYCSGSNVQEMPGINRIVVVDKPYDHNDPVVLENFYDEVKKLTNNENYDFVISENITPPIDMTFLQGHSLVHRRKKLKNFLASMLYHLRPVKMKRIKYQQKWLSSGYRKIFVVSIIQKQDIAENFNIPENKISVIYPGVDIPDANLSRSHCERPTGAWQSQDITVSLSDTKNLAVFGLSAPGFQIKGGYVLLKAINILKNKGLKFRAKIIYPKYRKNLFLKIILKLYGIEEYVDFIGFQEDMNDFYSSINCLVAPSLEDAFNLTVLEAMARKKVCIVSSSAGASEIIRDGENGFIFSMNKKAAENLAEKMAFVISNYADITDRCIVNAYDTAKTYSWDKMYSEFMDQIGVSL